VILAKPAILEAVRDGRILIEPFNAANVRNSSVDVTLGEWYWQETHPPHDTDMVSGILNPYDRESIYQMWGGTPKRAIGIREARPGIPKGTKVIPIRPGENLLCHTVEFIGGTDLKLTTMMKARSSIGRNQVTVCRCVDPTTEVRLSSGVAVPIKKLKPGDRVIGADRNGRSRCATVKAVATSAPKRYLKITTEGGRTLRCSEDHYLRISRSSGCLTGQASSLRKGDQLPVLANWYPERVSNISRPLATLLGYFAAEGNYQKYKISFAKADYKKGAREEIMECMRTCFPHAPVPKEYRDQISYNSVDFAEYFKRSFPAVACLGHMKRVPDEVFSSHIECVREFLRAYLSCDAHRRKKSACRELQTSSRSPRLIEDIGLLAARFDAVPRFNQRRSGAANNVMSFGMYYGDDCAKVTGTYEPSPKNSKNRVVYIKKLLGDIGPRYKLYTSKLTEKESISPKRLRRMIANSGHVPELDVYLNDIAWDRVVSIERSKLEMEMCDISLDVPSEDDSLFLLGNGLMVLNCAGAGDVGYASRWTLEVSNYGRRTTLLVCGRRIAQLWFMETTGLLDASESYNAQGKYQHGSNRGKSLAELEAQWKPEDMLPKMFLDDEVVGNSTGIVVPTDEDTFEHGFDPTKGWKVEIG
jgi:deoxycytidine triphosphate deaminase